MTRSTNTQFAVAVHVLTYLAGIDDGRPASSDELSKSTNVNPVHIRRVMGPLRDAGLVRSRPGVHGGWELALTPSRVSLDQVWLLLQGTDPVLGLHDPDPVCATGRSVQKSLIALDQKVAGAIAASLQQVTVQHLLAEVHSDDGADLRARRKGSP
ncbi:Rrf2 family transcriptional regulator [Lentzea flava]|uniref:Transcriptional regulator n=1 Tax=Lentzea flava TaxID=103732 RepID=A0ABQ2VHG0_9PSEU|nr:Rrf2 family transcriptional regulator [Lentzea flava]MCP2205475.1 Rrf2 family protein [Lentzea flava]GGU87114.1 transcriptional regulator [Lentzea flava]